MSSAVHQRLLRGGRALSSPTDVLLAARMLPWAVVLPLLKAVLPLGRLVRMMALVGKPDARHRHSEKAIATLARLTHRAVGLGRRDNCLERSLLAYRYLAAANANPVLVVGARTGPCSVEGHVWLTVGGAPVYEEPAKIELFLAVMAFDASGALLPPVVGAR